MMREGEGQRASGDNDHDHDYDHDADDGCCWITANHSRGCLDSLGRLGVPVERARCLRLAV